MVTPGRFAPTKYARRRLMRLAFYWFAGGVAGVLMYLVIGIYAALFV